ncbi:MAG TPA: hypothetical protein VMS78_14680 [Rhizomicrobium sp.]|nr:hypothetical protein [Rhizomicrobium sp.]
MSKALLVAFAFACAAIPAKAETLFHADFQNGKAEGWRVTGSAGLSVYGGNVSLKLSGPASATVNVSTAGYRDISVSFSFAGMTLGHGGCLGEVSTDGGATWQTSFKIGRGRDDGVTLHTGGGAVANANDDRDFQIRVRAASTGETCWADDILVTGRPLALPQAIDSTGTRRLLDFAALTGTGNPSPVSYSAFAPPAHPSATKNRFEGRLVFTGASAQSRVYRDDYGDFKDKNSPAHSLPPFDFAFVQSGNALLPVRRGAIASSSPDWEFILEPGRVWDEPGDRGYSRASLPFTLEERNANCMHNGVLTFLFRNDGQVSRIAYQIGSETCLYAKFDMWGTASAHYIPEAIPAASTVASAYDSEIAHRLPTKPIADLAVDHPGIDPTRFGSASEIDPDTMTVFGLVVDGVNYTGGCATRFGPYPYCNEMDLPSYSLAKSIFAGEASMRLSLLYPGMMQNKIADYVPACAAQGTWGDVTFENALDMATGHYLSPADQADEDAPDIAPFFAADTHNGRIEFACTHYPRKTKPGTKWIYHTADTYILGTALRAFYRSKAGPEADFYRGVLVDPIFRALHLNPAIDVTRRSYDDVREPFAGWGLTLHADDIAKIADFLNIDGGRIAGEQLLDPKMLAAALQRDPRDPGLQASNENIRYNNSLWAWNAQSVLGCKDSAWIAFMSGYGGIAVAMMPNHITYYYVSDGGRYVWARAAAEANRIKPFCERGSHG